MVSAYRSVLIDKRIEWIIRVVVWLVVIVELPLTKSELTILHSIAGSTIVISRPRRCGAHQLLDQRLLLLLLL